MLVDIVHPESLYPKKGRRVQKHTHVGDWKKSVCRSLDEDFPGCFADPTEWSLYDPVSGKQLRDESTFGKHGYFDAKKKKASMVIHLKRHKRLRPAELATKVAPSGDGVEFFNKRAKGPSVLEGEN